MVEQSDNLVEIYSKPPTQFLANNWQKLLPSWKTAPQTLVITLLKSEFSLEQEGDRVAQEKDRLLKEFLSRGKLFYSLSQEKGYLAEVISPKDGTPQYTTKGELTFDLVAIVHESLGWNFSRTNEGCKVLIHPNWGTNIYPGLFLSTARK
jgi:hypothetical protein